MRVPLQRAYHLSCWFYGTCRTGSAPVLSLTEYVGDVTRTPVTGARVEWSVCA